MFLAKDELGTAENYFTKGIRDKIKRSDLFVFLLSSHSIEDGRFTLSEWSIASKHKLVRRLPVQISDVDYDRIPGDIQAISILRPQGDLVADIAACVDRIAAESVLLRRILQTRWQLYSAIAVILTLVIVAASLMSYHLFRSSYAEVVGFIRLYDTARQRDIRDFTFAFQLTRPISPRCLQPYLDAWRFAAQSYAQQYAGRATLGALSEEVLARGEVSDHSELLEQWKESWFRGSTNSVLENTNRELAVVFGLDRQGHEEVVKRTLARLRQIHLTLRHWLWPIYYYEFPGDWIFPCAEPDPAM